MSLLAKWVKQQNRLLFVLSKIGSRMMILEIEDIQDPQKIAANPAVIVVSPGDTIFDIFLYTPTLLAKRVEQKKIFFNFLLDFPLYMDPGPYIW